MQSGAGGGGVALGEDQVQHMEDRRHAIGAFLPQPAGEMGSAVLVCFFARVIRRVMVASETRNARATSVMVRPSTARRVSAICDSGDSMGWQHMNNKISMSSASAGFSAGSSPLNEQLPTTTVSSRRRRACSLRSMSVSLRAATVINQPLGCPEHPRSATGLWPPAYLLYGVLGGIEVAVATYHRAENLRRQLAQQALDLDIQSRTPDLRISS